MHVGEISVIVLFLSHARDILIDYTRIAGWRIKKMKTALNRTKNTPMFT